MATILDEIVAYKREYVGAARAAVSLDEVRRVAEESPEPDGFFDQIVAGEDVAIIAEVKQASPSKGLIRADFDPVAIAEIYQSNGASAISVLTDEKYFQGSNEYLTSVNQSVDLPLLRKEFIIDSYQIYEARAIGASAVLLIVSILTPQELAGYLDLCRQLALDALVEVHTSEEKQVALDSGTEILGINNRNLKTFETDLNTTFRLVDDVSDEVLVVSESGIHSRDDVENLRDAGASAVLVGESLMREPDIGSKLRELAGYGAG